jgi:ketosteroid isomerase-like protein
MEAAMSASQPANFQKCNRSRVAEALCILLTCVAMALTASAADQSREHLVKIVTQIQRADYEGDRSALKRLYGELSPFVKDRETAARVRYWRGFALWRRAINGFNDKVDATELQEDLKHALEEFNEAAKVDSGFADAKIGALSCVSLIGFTLIQKDPARMQDADVQQLWAKARQLRKEAEALAPENPRLPWVMGPNVWNTPAERGGGQARAIEMYEKGLETIRSHKTTAGEPLEPSWGEPELLMNLAYSSLHRSDPDLNAAEQYARSALELVPYWHYVRDILVPQIQKAKGEAEAVRGEMQKGAIQNIVPVGEDRYSEQIIATERAALDRWGKGDPQGYLESMAPEATYFDPFQEKRIDGLETIKALLAPITGKVKVDRYEMINPEVQRIGDVAVLTFNLLDQVTPPGGGSPITIRWNSTEVYRRIAGNWKIIHSHWSYTKPERSARN